MHLEERPELGVQSIKRDSWSCRLTHEGHVLSIRATAPYLMRVGKQAKGVSLFHIMLFLFSFNSFLFFWKFSLFWKNFPVPATDKVSRGNARVGPIPPDVKTKPSDPTRCFKRRTLSEISRASSGMYSTLTRSTPRLRPPSKM